MATNASFDWTAALAHDVHDGLIFRAGRRLGIRLVVADESVVTPAADYSLSGRASVQPDDVRVTFRLYRSATAENVWVEQIDLKRTGGYFELVDRICNHVDTAIRM